MSIFVSSDMHFGHQKSFLYEPRGFESIFDHDEHIIKRWNELVGIDDDVYILGDIMLNDNIYGISCFKRLHGHMHIILGNHDTEARAEIYRNCWNVKEVVYATQIKHNGINFYLSHYPTKTVNYDQDKPMRRRIWNLCGHSHTKDKFQDMEIGAYHCELDAHNNEPVAIDTIINDIEKYLQK